MRFGIRHSGGLPKAIERLQSHWTELDVIIYKAEEDGREVPALVIQCREDGALEAIRKPGRGEDALIGVYWNLEQAIVTGLAERFDGLRGWPDRIATGNVPGALILKKPVVKRAQRAKMCVHKGAL